MSVKGGLANASISFNETPSAGITAGNTFSYPAVSLLSNFAAGTAADQLDGVSESLLTLLASTPQTVNLFTSLKDLLGVAIVPARIRFIAIKVLSKVDGAVLLVGDAVTNEFDGFLSAAATMTVFPSSPGNDGFTVISAPNTTGMPVDATHCNLKFDPGGNAMNVILVVGASSV